MSASKRIALAGIAALSFGSGALAADAAGAGDQDLAIEVRDSAVPAIDYLLRAGVTYTDNLFRAPAGLEASAGAFAVGVDARGSRDTGRLTYETNANLVYNTYFSDYDSELIGNAFFNGAYEFAQDMFFWNGTFRYDQVREDFSRPLVPGNIGDQISWSTGPQLRFRLGATMEADLEGHYQAERFSGSYSDNTTVGGRFMLARRSGPRSRVALGASVDSVSYADDTIASQYDFDRQEAFVRLERAFVRTRVDGEVGYADVSGQLIDDSGPMFRGSLSHRLTPTLSAFVGYVHEYPTSSAPTYTEDPSDPNIESNGSATLSAAPRVADTFRGSLVMTRARTEARLSYSLVREDSLIEELGRRDFSEANFLVSRRFTPKATGSFFISHTDEEFTAFPDDATETNLGAQLEILLGRATGLQLRIGHRDRNSEESTNASSEFFGGLFFTYSGAFDRRARRNLEDSLLQ